MTSYIGEIRIFAGNFAPQGWFFCQGQLLQISEFDTLYSLIGTTYGGDGQTTFALPDLRSRAVLGQGQLPGGSTYQMGQQLGQENVTLTTNQMPVHQHPVSATLQAHTGTPAQDSPEGAYFGDKGGRSYGANNGSTKLGAGSVTNPQVGPAGGSQPHTNIQPLLVINYIISWQGIYPGQP
jgi:microcystin-dependent protein